MGDALVGPNARSKVVGMSSPRQAIEEQRSILSVTSVMPEPVSPDRQPCTGGEDGYQRELTRQDTCTKIVRRIRALVTKLLPVEVEIAQISDATSSIITPQVINAFAQCGGDFTEAVPFW